MQKGMNSSKSEERTKKSLNYSTKDGTAATVTVGAADNFVSAYAVALKATNFQIGLLSALPTLMPVELITTSLMKKFSRKRIVLAGVLVQIALLILMAVLGVLIFKETSLLAASLLILLFTLYASTGLFISPAWYSWMKDLTEKIELGKYFGMRNKIFGIVSLITIICAGIILSIFKKTNLVFYGFAFLFIVAALARTVSRAYLKKQHEPKLRLKKEFFFSFWEFMKKAPSNNYGRFAIFIALINFSVMIASPFFSPYMLNDLKFGYIAYTIINLVISGLATLITMPLWGRFLDKCGCVKTMRLTVWAIPIIPLLWLVSHNILWLVFIQIISGVIWAGFNLASGTFTFNAVTKERMNLCIAYSSILNGIAIFLGATLGGIIASLPIGFMNVFLFVFLVSGIVRSIVITLLFPLIREVRPVKPEKPILKMILKQVHNLDFFEGFSNLIHPRNNKKNR
jgi:MFS family permease